MTGSQKYFRAKLKEFEEAIRAEERLAAKEEYRGQQDPYFSNKVRANVIKRRESLRDYVERMMD